MLWALLGLLTVARAQDPDLPWYVGRTVAYVSLESETGDLPEDDLAPLLQVNLGQPLQLGDVRHDIEVLMRAGQFASVEAHAEPWPLSETETGVWVQFRIVSPPQIRRVRFAGARGLPRQLVRDAMRLPRGAAFFVEEQQPAMEIELRAMLEDAGWPDAQVQIRTEEVEPGLIDLTVMLDPGEMRRYQDVVIVGETGLPEKTLRRQLRRMGIAPGRRVDRRRLLTTRDAVRDSLTDGHQQMFSPRRQWLEARVNIVHDVQPGGDVLNVFVNAGPGVEVASRGRGAPRSAEATEALQLFAGDRVSADRLPEMERALETWFHKEGYRSPTITLSLEEEDWGHRLKLQADRGAIHRLRRISVTGASEFSEAYLASAIRQAAPDSLRQGFVTDEGLQAALRKVEQFYRGQGFLDAEVTLVEEEIIGDGGWRQDISVDVSLVVNVQEGPRTWLRSLEVAGSYGLEAQQIDAARAELVGPPTDAALRRPLIRARLDGLRQQVTDQYRAAGYLDADVQLQILESVDENGLRVADARLIFEPEERVFLRSIIVQGNVRTRRDVVIRGLDLKVGEPVTPEGLARSRRQLYELGTFRVVSPELLGNDPRQRDLIVRLEERPNLLVEGGGGISTDQGSRVTARAVHRNLGGRAWRITALGQIGYAWKADSFVPAYDEPLWRTAVRYEGSGFRGRSQTLIVEGLLNETSQEPSFRLSRRGASLGLQLSPRSGLEAVFSYRLQWRQIEDVAPGAVVPQDPWYLLLEDPISPVLPSPWRYQGGPGIQVLYDRRDDRFNPTRGGYLLGRTEVSDGLSSGLLFLRLNSRGEVLLPIGMTTFRLGFQGGAGLVGGGQTLPLEDRFFLGGADSLRGFALNTVGPANLTPRPEIDYPIQIESLMDATALRDSSVLWTYTGGDTLMLASIEARTPLSRLGLEGWDTTQLVVFCDAGQVWFRDPAIVMETGTITEMEPLIRIGTGVGLRLATPIGPASLELGINPARMVSREEARFVPHISLGAL